MKTGRTFNARRWMALGAVALVMLAPAATEACSDCGARTVSVAQEKARESRDLVDAPGTLRMHAPAARFFRTNGAFRQFKATVGFDPAIHTKHSYGPKHVAGTLMGFRVYADKKLVADTGLIRPGDGTRTIDVDVSGARTVVLESVDGGFWTGTPSLLALWQDVRFVGDGGATLEEDMSGAETPQFGILTPSDEPEPRLNGSWTYGVRPGKPILYRVAVTGEKPLEVSVVGELPKGLAFDAQRRLLTGSLEQRGDYEVVFAARNARGKAERTLKIRVGDKLCLTPPMGWNSWNAWGCAVSDKIVRDTAATFLEKGLADHGWTYVNIDDGWPRSALDANPPATGSASDPKRRGDPRDENGVIRPNGYFPDMKALGDYLHSHGLKFGIYSSPGPRTCNRYEGTYGHDALDAATWASWGVDYVKYDWCYYREIFAKETAGRKPTDEDRIKPFRKLYGELLRQPRDMVYSFSGGGGPKWGEANGSNLWRTWTDLKDGWGCLLNAAKSSARQYQNSHPGFWADPDMLIVGRLRTGSFPGAHDTVLTPNEQYTHLSLWAVMNAPLLLGCQMNVIDDFTVKLLVNPEVIDVDQDVAEAPGRIVFENGEDLVLAKTLCDGSTAICAVNLCPFKRRVTVNFKDAGLTGRVRLRDLWRRRDIGTFQDSFTTELPPHAPLFVRCFK